MKASNIAIPDSNMRSIESVDLGYMIIIFSNSFVAHIYARGASAFPK